MYSVLFKNYMLAEEKAKRANAARDTHFEALKRCLCQAKLVEADDDVISAAKRQCTLESLDKRLYIAGLNDTEFFEKHFWRFVEHVPNGEVHCSRKKCGYKKHCALAFYTGFYVCTIEPLVFYCDNCFIELENKVGDITQWMHILSDRETVQDIINGKKVSDGQWHPIVTTRLCDLCDETTMYHMRDDTNDHYFCEECYKNKKP
jgi:hypothetical protein